MKKQKKPTHSAPTGGTQQSLRASEVKSGYIFPEYPPAEHPDIYPGLFTLCQYPWKSMGSG